MDLQRMVEAARLHKFAVAGSRERSTPSRAYIFRPVYKEIIARHPTNGVQLIVALHIVGAAGVGGGFRSVSLSLQG